MESLRLRNCPICGQEPMVLNKRIYVEREEKRNETKEVSCYVFCKYCGIESKIADEGKAYNLEYETIKQWNKQAETIVKALQDNQLKK